MALDKIIEKAVDSFLEPITKTLIDKAKEEFGNFQVDMGKCFTEYLIRNYDKYSKIKTLFYTQQPVPLEQFYVRTRLSRPSKNNHYKKEIIEEKDFCTELIQNRRIVVSGTAGLGKSTFCKSIFLELIREPQGIFPIFIELRNINNEQEQTLLEYIFSKVFLINESFTKSQLKYAIQNGKILLILDGYDEIHYYLRDKYQKEILELSDTNHNILILVSSRPDNVFRSWNEFFEYHIQPLNKENAIKLISKIDYDEMVKENFVLELKKGLFEKHQSFAKIPLLLNIMLLTYQKYAEIPTKIHLFYERAFLTLFHEYDSYYKNQFKRELYTSDLLDSEQFKKVFSVFCYLTYINQLYMFNDGNLNQYIKKAQQYCYSNQITPKQYSTEQYIQDLRLLCLIHQDGLDYTFTHRSFQEYFAAYFITNIVDSLSIFNILEKLYNNNIYVFNRLIHITFTLEQNLIETQWVRKSLNEFLTQLDDIEQSDTQIKALKKIFNVINSVEINNITKKNMRKINIYTTNFLAKYWNVIESLYTTSEQARINEKKILEYTLYLLVDLRKTNFNSSDIYIYFNDRRMMDLFESDSNHQILIKSKFYQEILSIIEARKQFAKAKIKEIEDRQNFNDNFLDL